MPSSSIPRLAAAGFLVLASVLGSAAVASASPAAPGPTAGATSYHPLAAVACTKVTSCVAVGQDLTAGIAGVPLAETWNGKKWSVTYVRLPSGGRSNWQSTLDGVSCPAASNCVAVGSYQAASGKIVPLAEVWNGRKWTPAAMPLPKGAIGAALNAVSCRTVKSCLAVGGYSTSDGSYQTLAATWNGSRWADAPAHATGSLSGVACPSATFCAAVGDAWLGSGPAGQPPLAETWNGAKWSVVKAPAPKGNQGAALGAVSCASAKSCVATGDYHLTSGSWVALAETWNGTRWAAVAPPSPPGSYGYYVDLRGVSCTAAARCLAVGEYGGAGYDIGTAYADAWNGTAWKAVKVPAVPGGEVNGSVLTSIRCLSAASCAAVGFYGPQGGQEYGYSAFWNGKTWKLIPAA